MVGVNLIVFEKINSSSNLRAHSQNLVTLSELSYSIHPSPIQSVKGQEIEIAKS